MTDKGGSVFEMGCYGEPSISTMEATPTKSGPGTHMLHFIVDSDIQINICTGGHNSKGKKALSFAINHLFRPQSISLVLVQEMAVP